MILLFFVERLQLPTLRYLSKKVEWETNQVDPLRSTQARDDLE
jgi:hypothetical protein